MDHSLWSRTYTTYNLSVYFHELSTIDHGLKISDENLFLYPDKNYMPNKFHRKDFLKLAVLANLSLYAKPIEFLATKQLIQVDEPFNNDNVIFYKKEDAEYDKLRHGFNKRINNFPAAVLALADLCWVADTVCWRENMDWPVIVYSK